MESKLSELINWNFRAVLGLQASRYGDLNGKYYKQYIPNGIVIDEIYPPKEISQQVYDASKRLAESLKQIDFTRR